MKKLNKVGIIGGARIPFCRSVTNYADLGNRELLTACLKILNKKYDLSNKDVGEVVSGAVLKRSKDFSMARESSIDAGIHITTPAYDIQHACGTSLHAAILVANKIAMGAIESGVAAGVDTSSDVPIEFKKTFANKLVKLSKARSTAEKFKLLFSIGPTDLLPKIPGVKEPRTGLSMGEHCEQMVKDWKISREEQDKLSFASHANASKALSENFFDDLVYEFHGVKVDNNIRKETTLEKLAKLKPAFDFSSVGTLTAGNSSPLTDGAAAVFLASEKYAKENNLEIESYLVDYEVAAVDYVKTEGLLMAPVYAVPKMLARNNLKLQDFDYYEIHEAFAGQVLCTLKAWEDTNYCQNKLGLKEALGSIDRAKLNVKGSSVAIGHPFAATGARILATASKLLKQKGSGRVLISICTAGGMGVTAIVEK